MMLNVHSIFKHTIEALNNNKVITTKTKIEDLKTNLIIEIDNILKNILINLADSYPQAPPSGGTIRMR